MIHKLLLFDIDGTLLHAGITPSVTFADSIGTILREPVEFPKRFFFGRTDTFIIREMLRRTHHFSPDGCYHQIRDLFIQRMKERFPRSTDGFVIPGIEKYLDILITDPTITLGLVTGNFRETAYVKLSHFGLDHYFETGGFGDNAEDRPELVRQAVENTSRFYNRYFNPKNIVIIGDTLHDIQSARHWGYRSVVISSVRDKDELLQACPDVLVENYHGLTDSHYFFL